MGLNVELALTLAGTDFQRDRKPTRREQFLAVIEAVVPWEEHAALIEPNYRKVTPAEGRPPVAVQRMLRIYCLRLWFDRSNTAVKEAPCDSLAMRALVGIDLGC